MMGYPIYMGIKIRPSLDSLNQVTVLVKQIFLYVVIIIQQQFYLVNNGDYTTKFPVRPVSVLQYIIK